MIYSINHEGEEFIRKIISSQRKGLVLAFPIAIFLNFMILARTNGQLYFPAFIILNCLLFIFFVGKPLYSNWQIKKTIQSIVVIDDNIFEISCFGNFFTKERQYTIGKNEIELIDYYKNNKIKIGGKEDVLQLKVKGTDLYFFIFSEYFKNISDFNNRILS